MERKKRTEAYVEPMPKEEFFSLMRNFKENGGKYYADENSEAFLNAQCVEACTLNEYTILFKRKPSRSAVYEELFHVQQFKNGKIDGTIYNAYENEIEAQLYLLTNAKELKLTATEIEQTKNALKWYQNEIAKMKGENDK